jgi:hypothetical protein
MLAGVPREVFSPSNQGIFFSASASLSFSMPTRRKAKDCLRSACGYRDNQELSHDRSSAWEKAFMTIVTSSGVLRVVIRGLGTSKLNSSVRQTTCVDTPARTRDI